MSKTRRDFLRSIASVGAAGAASQLTRFGALTAHAQSASDYKALVCIFLNGGNDSNNMIVPVDSRYAAYATIRGPVALASSALLPAGTGGLGFHPSMPNIRGLYNQNAAAIALNVGTLVQPTTRATLAKVRLPNMLRSHEDQTQQWQSGDPFGGSTGWGGRVSDVMKGYNTGSLPPGIAVTTANAFFLAGAQTSPVNVSDGWTGDLRKFGSTTDMNARLNSLQRLLTFDSGLKLVTAANGVLASSVRSSLELSNALAGAAPLPVPFPTSNLGLQLAQIAKLISVRGALGMNRQIFFASIGGFDTHESVLSVQERLLNDVDQSVSSLFKALDAFGLTNNVTLFTESEFGRQAVPNATLGADHAWGGHHLIIGGAVRGGTYGTFPTLQLRGPDDESTSGVWIPTTSLDQYAATLGGWFGVSDADLDQIFPNLTNFAARQLRFLPGVTFTNNPMTSGTPVRSAHMTELRSAIATLRARSGLSSYVWTDAVLVPGVTNIKSAHLTELRAALADVYVAAGRTPPVYTDPTVTFIRAVHIAELRAAVLAIW